MRIQGGTVEHGDRTARRIVLPLLLACLGAALTTGIAAAAKPGDLDTSFSGDGRVTTDLGGSDRGYAVAIQPDGRIVVAGTTTDGEATALTRYDADGSLDTGFGGGDGKVITTRPGKSIRGYDVALQPDGKIVVGGTYVDASPSGPFQSDFMAIRYRSEGELDDSFSGDGIATVDFGGPGDSASGVAVDDGRIVLGGSVDGTPVYDLGIARLDENGDPDTAFSGDGRDTADAGGDDYGEDIAIQEGGEMLVVGGTLPDDFVAARFLSAGGLDESFSGDGIQTTTFPGGANASSVTVQSDGKIILAGVSGTDIALARYGEEGSPDTSFGDQGTAVTDFGDAEGASEVAADLHGGIVVAGTLHEPSGNTRFALARYDEDGHLDSSFSTNGKLTTDFSEGPSQANGMAIQDGRIVVAGTVEEGTGSDFALARYLGEGGSCGGLDATIAGTAEADELTGTVGPDVIDAGAGGDVITGLAGDDLICGGEGADEIKGVNGNDDLRGQSGADGLRGGKGRDKARGSKGRDTIRGAKGRDKMKGGAGGDFIRGGKSRDKLRGGGGFDNCKGGPGKDRLKGC